MDCKRGSLRIAYVLESSYNSGGMERMLSVISNEMSKYFDVTVITAFNESKKDYFFFSNDINRIDLGICPKNYLTTKLLKLAYKRQLSNYLCNNHQDIVISLGSLEFYFLTKIKDYSKKVFWFHFALNYDIITFNKTHIKLLNLGIGKIKQFRRLYYASKYDKVVVLSKEDCKRWNKYLDNVIYIYNPITISQFASPDYSVEKAIAVGRLDFQKGFDFLIDAWKLVHFKYPDWALDIYGDGLLKSNLQRLIDKNDLCNIVNLCGKVDNIADVYSKYSLSIMTSRYEGFGLVLVEAGICGLPLIAFDCESGPNEIIINGQNGYLIDMVGDVKGLSNAICDLIENESEREKMGKRASITMNKFSLKEISKKWNELMYSLVK